MSSPARAWVAVLSTLAALAAGPADHLSARQSRVAGERAPGFSVDFVAVQADGTPAADLLSSEVEVRINDKVRVIRSLRRVSTATVPSAPNAVRVPPPYGTNDNVTVGRRFILLGAF